jgi:hypothetical protein
MVAVEAPLAYKLIDDEDNPREAPYGAIARLCPFAKSDTVPDGLGLPGKYNGMLDVICTGPEVYRFTELLILPVVSYTGWYRGINPVLVILYEGDGTTNGTVELENPAVDSVQVKFLQILV